MAGDAPDALRSFIEGLSHTTDLDDLARATGEASARCGLPTVMAGAIVTRLDETNAHFYFGNWPAEWRARYPKEILADDPLVAQAKRRLTPFTWTELKREGDLPENIRRAFEATHEAGWLEGFAVPIHGPGGYVALVSFAGAAAPLDAAARATLTALAHLAHQKGRELHGRRADASAPEFSARELQVMRWVAAGKTDSEIAQIIGVSRHTAHFHVEQVKRKLNVRSRGQAVGELMFRGEL